MNKCLTVIGVFLVLLVGCKVPPTAPQPSPLGEKEACLPLAEIDTLLWQRPDSAFVLLRRFAASPQADSMDEYNTHYFHLLLAELFYKNDCAQSNRPNVLQAVDYYDGHCGRFLSLSKDNPQSPHLSGDIAFLSARAHYINGVGYYERDSIVQACEEYLKALEVMESNYKEEELVGKKAKFMALAYTRLTDLFSDFYLHEQAIRFAQSSLVYYNRSNNPSWYTARMLNEIGSQYDMMDQLDSAAYYYQRAKKVVGDTASLLYRDIAAHLIYLKYKEGKCQADTSVKRLRQMLPSSESDRERQARYQYIGEIFYHEQRYDSAWVYLNTSFHTTSVVGLKRQAAEWLVEICKVQGKEEDILEYANFLVPFANQEENQSATKSGLTELYKTFEQARQERHYQKEMRQRGYQSIVIAFGWFFITLIIFALLYFYNKRRKQRLENQIEAERHAHKIQQAALSGRLKRSNAAMKEKKEDPHNDKAIIQNHYHQAENYVDEPICRQILTACNDESNTIKTSIPVSSYANIALNDAQKVELKIAAKAHYAHLFETIKRQHPELKEKDFMYCYLCLLGLDNAQIAVMTQLSYRTIWEREKRLQRIFRKEEKISIILNEMLIG